MDLMIRIPNWMFGCQIIEGFGPRVSVACTCSPGSDLQWIVRAKDSPHTAFVWQIPTFRTLQICSFYPVQTFVPLRVLRWPWNRNSSEVTWRRTWPYFALYRSSQQMFLDDAFDSRRNGLYWSLSNICDGINKKAEADHRPNCSNISMNSWQWEGFGSHKECHLNVQRDATKHKQPGETFV